MMAVEQWEHRAAPENLCIEPRLAASILASSSRSLPGLAEEERSTSSCVSCRRRILVMIIPMARRRLDFAWVLPAIAALNVAEGCAVPSPARGRVTTGILFSDSWVLCKAPRAQST